MILLLGVEGVALLVGFLFSFTMVMLIPQGGEERYIFTAYWFRYYSAAIFVSNFVLAKCIFGLKCVRNCDGSRKGFIVTCFQAVVFLSPLIFSLFFEKESDSMSLAMTFSLLHVFPLTLISPVLVIVMSPLVIGLRAYLLWTWFPGRGVQR